MSVGRSLLRGSTPTDLSERYINLPGYVKARQDHAIDGGIPIEAKFGTAPTLSEGQQIVYDQDRYGRVDHFVPQDVATIASIPVSQFASGLFDGWKQNERDQREREGIWRSLLVPPQP
jgi:hypothetical protein